MNLQIDLKQDFYSSLQAEADSHGQSLQDFVVSVLLHHTEAGARRILFEKAKEASFKKFDEAYRKLAISEAMDKVLNENAELYERLAKK
jgi:uncharacterized protein (DUF1778 family)